MGISGKPYKSEKEKPVEKRVRSFGFRLRMDFGEKIRKDPSKFKSRVLGTLKAVLPRKTPRQARKPGDQASGRDLRQFVRCERSSRQLACTGETLGSQLCRSVSRAAALAPLPAEITDSQLPL